jgi:hypothetical protein
MFERLSRRKRKVTISAPGDEDKTEDSKSGDKGEGHKKIKLDTGPVSTELGHRQHDPTSAQASSSSTFISSAQRATPGFFMSPKPRRIIDGNKVTSPESSTLKSEKEGSKANTPTRAELDTKSAIDVVSTRVPSDPPTERLPTLMVPKSTKNGRRKSEAAILKEEAKQQRVKERAEKKAKEKEKKEREAREKKMTPIQYAATVHEKWKDKLAKTPEERLCFKGCNVLYVGADLRISSIGTRNKMDRVSVPSYVITGLMVSLCGYRSSNVVVT